MKLIDWFKSLPSSILFALQKRKKIFDEKIDSRDEVYNKPIINKTTKHGFTINDDLIAKILLEKYKKNKLTDEGEFKKSNRKWTKKELKKQNKK